jgi:hypothetical protein
VVRDVERRWLEIEEVEKRVEGVLKVPKGLWKIEEV